jgi:hypothetical protein
VSKDEVQVQIPFFGARRVARAMAIDNQALRQQHSELGAQFEEFRIRTDSERLAAAAQLAAVREDGERLRRRLIELDQMGIVEREVLARELERQLIDQRLRLDKEQAEASQRLRETVDELERKRSAVVQTDENAILQEVGVYRYRHPLTDAVSYEAKLEKLQSRISEMAKKEGGAVLAATNWSVNGSVSEGRAMVRDFSKLMLRAFNAEADNLVRGLKPYKLERAVERLEKVAATIEKLGKIMQVRISGPYLQLREQELELTADFLQKKAEEKEVERQERERLREERKVQQEMETERAKLEKERQHCSNALKALIAKGDQAGAERVKAQMDDVERAIADVDYRAVNVRAGYVYVISNIGSFGERMVKVGLTRRLDPLDRIKELSDASVPFNFDVHAVFFSKDAVGIEQALHQRLGTDRVNSVNLRREFFRVSPMDVKAHLAELAGELLQFHDEPEALEYRQCLRLTEGTAKP